MAIEEVKTINELERLTALTDDNAFAASSSNATGSVTSKMIKTYLEAYLEKLANKVTSISASSNDTEYPSAKAVYENSVKAGTIIAWPISEAPEGYLICDGAAVSRTLYADLFAVIGTTYGEGDGNSTFNLPNKKFLNEEVKGNGLALGLTNGTANYGLYEGDTGGQSNSGALRAYGGAYGQTVPNVGTGAIAPVNQSIGITTDSSKSGIIVDSDSNIVYAIKY